MEIYKNLSLENMEGEIWKDIEGFEKKYQISNMGRVKALNFKRSGKEKIMKQSFNGRGYLKVGLRKDGKFKTLKVHRLVAQTFIENKENKPCVDHKNTIRTDNRVENLRFVTHKENNNNELTRKHNSESQKGRKHTEEGKKKISEAHKGKVASEEAKRKMSEANKGRNNSSYKGFVCIFPNGEVTKEMTNKELGELLGVSSSVITNIAKSGEPYKPRSKKLKYLEGIKIYYYQDYLKLESGDKIA